MIRPAKSLRIENPDEELLRRFRSKVTVGEDADCWLWTGYIDSKGYGQFWFRGRTHWAHRISYALFKGRVRYGQQVDHVCGNSTCVNPAHLEAVSAKENRRRQQERLKDAADLPF